MVHALLLFTSTIVWPTCSCSLQMRCALNESNHPVTPTERCQGAQVGVAQHGVELLVGSLPAASAARTTHSRYVYCIHVCTLDIGRWSTCRW